MKQKIIFFLSLLSILFFFDCCKKTTGINEDVVAMPQHADFFQLPSNASPQLRALAADIKQQDDLDHFIAAVAKRNGSPVWDMVVSNVPVTVTGDSTTITSQKAGFLVPLQIPNGSISSYIACLQTDTGYAYRLYSRPAVEAAVKDSARYQMPVVSLPALLVFGYFEKVINHKDLVRLAGTMYNGIEVSLSDKVSENGRVADGSWEQVLVSICVPKRGFRQMDGSMYINPLYCTETVMTAWVSGGGGSGGGNGGGNSGGGGGSGTGGGGFNGNYQCPPQMWWCETGDYRIINGNLYTADNYPGINNRLPWAWWESEANYQNWANHDIRIIEELAASLALNRAATFWLVENPAFAEEMQHLLFENDYSADARATSKTVLSLYMQDLQSGVYNSDVENILNLHLKPSLTSATTIDPIYWFHIGLQAGFNKIDHPRWSKLRCYWEAMSESIHTGLDMAGMVPGFGEIADLTNGVIYTIEGNGVDASLSFAAAIPFAGWFATSAKYARKTIYAFDGTKRTLKWFKEANNFISFGDRNLLRKVMGLSVGDARVAHHIIPWNLWDHDLIQKLAKSKNSFHLNERYNGLVLTTIQHAGSHSQYSERVFDALEAIQRQKLSDDDAFREVKILLDKISTAINNNPTVSINNVIF